jgi:hypothetical protein
LAICYFTHFCPDYLCYQDMHWFPLKASKEPRRL